MKITKKSSVPLLSSPVVHRRLKWSKERSGGAQPFVSPPLSLPAGVSWFNLLDEKLAERARARSSQPARDPAELKFLCARYVSASRRSDAELLSCTFIRADSRDVSRPPEEGRQVGSAPFLRRDHI